MTKGMLAGNRMIMRVKSEIKIIGMNFFIISAAFTSALIVLSAIAGELLNFYPVSFEVMFPFFVTIAVGEWGNNKFQTTHIKMTKRMLVGDK